MALCFSSTIVRTEGPPAQAPTPVAPSPPSIPTPSDQPVGKNWLVLIAIDNYPDLRPLTAPVGDAQALRDILQERFEFSKDSTRELYEEKATNSGISKLFTRLNKEVGPYDSLLLFYAGHGVVDDSTNLSYWVPFDGKFPKENWIVDAEIKGFVQSLKARHVLIISDSCFSGGLLEGQRGLGAVEISEDYLKRAYGYRSRQAMTSGRLETVKDLGFGTHSPFAENLIRVLREEVQPIIDVEELWVKLRHGIQGQQPLLGALKESGHVLGGSFLFFRKGTLPPLPPTEIRRPPGQEDIARDDRPNDPPDDAIAKITETLSRWETAYEALDLPSLRKVWPDCGWGMEQFRGTEKLEIAMSPPKIELDGNSATASCELTFTTVLKNGGHPTSQRLATFELKRDADRTWKIKQYGVKASAR